MEKNNSFSEKSKVIFRNIFYSSEIFSSSLEIFSSSLEEGRSFFQSFDL